MTDDPVSVAARAAASHLAAQYGPGLTAEVEAALHTRGTRHRPEQYFDPVSLGSLIVSIASLAWTIYTGLKAKTANPAPEVLTRAVRVELRTRSENSTGAEDKITEVVVTEIIRTVLDLDRITALPRNAGKSKEPLSGRRHGPASQSDICRDLGVIDPVARLRRRTSADGRGQPTMSTDQWLGQPMSCANGSQAAAGC